jgi:hypothetical protein
MSPAIIAHGLFGVDKQWECTSRLDSIMLSVTLLVLEILRRAPIFAS